MNRQAEKTFRATSGGRSWIFKSSGLKKAWGRALAWCIRSGLDVEDLQVEQIAGKK